MPLNDYPAAKPTYNFSDTVTAGRTVLANGVLLSVKHNPASKEFPAGSVTWNWFSRAPVASYLVEDSVGNYNLSERTADNGTQYYEAQDTSISAAQQKKNRAIMNMQQNITEFESQFNGTYPFTSDGVVVGTPPASFEEEMQTMITFAGGFINTDVLYHENMHQWWGDNVTEGDYNLTFYKEGLATLAEYLYHARLAEDAAGGPYSRKGQAAFQASLVKEFNTIYAQGDAFWTAAPSNPEPVGLFSGSATYTRPGGGLHRAAPDPRPHQLHPGAGAVAAHLRRFPRHRARTGIRVRPVAAGAHQRLPGASAPVLHPVVGYRLPGRRRQEPAPDHRPRTGRPGFYNSHGGCS